MRLHLGCGRNILDGYTNLDAVAGRGVDIVADLGACKTAPLPIETDTVTEILASHVIEHVSDTLSLMQELYRVAKSGCELIVHVPYGSSDDAYEDPTHVRAYFAQSFAYFAQPAYWKADYGYRGDWQPKTVGFVVPAQFENMPASKIMRAIQQYRNVVMEMIVTLMAVKPARAQDRELLESPEMKILVHDER